MNAYKNADWHLLFGLLALQNGLISREQLVTAFAKWTSDKSVSLDQLLIDHGALETTTAETLRQLVELHVQRHGGDPQQTLMSLAGSDLPAAKAELAQLEDADLHQSIAAIPDIDVAATQPPTMGQVTSEGGRFRILRPLPGAQGGMGVISVARDEELGRQVALKQIIANMADHAAYRQKFQVEAEITGNLEHPGIVPVYGLGVGADGRPYYAMRLVHGDNLSEQIKQFHAALATGAVDYNSVEFHGLVDRLIDVAQAIRYAHSRGVLHRDLKPGNILVGKYGETLVIDWGLARLPQTEEESVARPPAASLDSQAPLNIRSGSNVDATMQGQILGTVGYAPPEQLNGRVDLITERSDVYALGAILYQILAGKAPVTSVDSSLDDLIKDTIEGKITPPRRQRRAVPKSLSAICMQALQRDPVNRYGSVEEFIAELERWKADQPVSAAPDSLTDRVMRLARRYRSAALAGTAALLGIALVAGTALVFVNRARLDETAARGEAETLAKEKTKLAEDKTELAVRNQAVVDSFVAAFRSADPENEGVTSKMTALEVLEQARGQIETDNALAEDELTKATLLTAIGQSLAALGAYKEANSAFAETLHLTTENLGDKHPATLESMHNLGNGYHAAGQLEKAIPLLEETLRLAENEWDDEQTCIVMTSLGNAYRAAGRLEEAISLLEETVQLARSKLGDDHPRALLSMVVLAQSYWAAGRLQKALPLAEETVRLTKAKLGEDHPTTLNARDCLAHAYSADGRLEEAIPLLENTLRLMRAKLGDDHPHTLGGMNNLGQAYYAAGRRSDANGLLKQSFHLTRAKLGEDHPQTLMSMNNLAVGYFSAGRPEDAAPLLNRAFQLTSAKLGDDHPQTLVSMHNLAVAYEAAGRSDEAILLMEEVLHKSRDKLGNDHPNTLRSMNIMANGYARVGRFAEALPLYEETLRLTKAKLDDTHPDTFRSMNDLAAGYSAAGRLAEAIPLYEETLHLRKAKLGDNHPDTLATMNHLAVGYHTAGRLAEAIPLYEETLRLRKANLGDDHPDTLDSMHNLAAGYQAIGRLTEALPLYEETFHARKAKLGDVDPSTLHTMNSLAAALIQGRRFNTAKPLVDELIDRLDAKKQTVKLARALTWRSRSKRSRTLMVYVRSRFWRPR